MSDPTNDPEQRWTQHHTPIPEWDSTLYGSGHGEDCDCPWCFENYLLSGIPDKSEPDTVNHPPHYCNRAMEAIDIIEMIIEIEPNPKVAYNMSNVLKYLLRFRDKGKPIHDLSKGVWYLNRMILKLEEEERKEEQS